MNFIEIAQHRQSCRNFNCSKPVEKEKILACLNAARLAPSACNSQPWHFTVCAGDDVGTKKNILAQVAVCTQEMGMNKFVSGACAFVVISESDYTIGAAVGAVVKRLDFRANDIGMATAYFTAEAVVQGLGTCILGWFNERSLKKLLGIKNRIRLVLAVGYAQDGDSIRIKKRKSIEEITNWL